MARAAIEVLGLHKSYRRGPFRKRKAVLHDISFAVPQGCVYGFLGPNGAGKSTTIKVLLGFVRYQAGTVRILGEPPAHASVRQRIGYLPETADYYPFLSPRRLLRLYSQILAIPRPVARKRVEELLELVGLANEKDERIGSFSKGMKQRVGIAQALLNEPELLILDEPASGLDPLGQREIRDLILTQRKAGRTIFFSSHELSEVEAVCDEAAIVRSGRIVRQGNLSELVPYREDLAVRVRAGDASVLEKQPFVARIQPSIRPGEVTFIAKPGESIAQVALAAENAGLELLSVGTARETLEDTFVRLMKEGRS